MFWHFENKRLNKDKLDIMASFLTVDLGKGSAVFLETMSLPHSGPIAFKPPFSQNPKRKSRVVSCRVMSCHDRNFILTRAKNPSSFATLQETFDSDGSRPGATCATYPWKGHLFFTGAALIYGSVCSGIEAATAAWHPLGWKASFFSEIEKFPRAVLAHHYPHTPLHGDFTTINAGDYGPIDLLVGGTPCQSFSIAGLRGGLGDDRGNLALEYLRLADRLRPRWLVWENVPGVLSSNGGRDFGAILGGMVELGYGIAYRVLDAQHFGVPQRRRRVFVVGYSGDWRRAAAVLFERESLRGDSPPRREARKDVAPTISTRPTGGGGLGTDFDLDGGLISMSLNAHPNRLDGESQTFVTHALTANGPGHDPVGTRVRLGSAVRRLTPTECERLKGFPDIEKSVTIFVCSSDRQKTSALAEIQNHKSLPSASNADSSALGQSAEAAARHSSISLRDQGWPVALNVRIDFERTAVEISSLGRLLWSASSAAEASWFLQSMPPADFVRLAAPMMQTLVPLTQAGKAASRPSTTHSTHHWNGSALVPVSGQEIDALASDATQFTSMASQFMKFTMLEPGPNFQNSELTLETWCCCVVAAINGFIPEQIRNGSSYALRIEGVTGYTNVPYRGKAAADGPRYKALGNSMAVPCMAWIGRRIAAVEALT